MAFYIYIYAPKQTQLSWVWDLLLITNLTQIFLEYVVSGLSVRFVSYHLPGLSLL